MNGQESAPLRFLYKTACGRIILRLLTTRRLSAVCGTFLDGKASRMLIKGFVRRNQIDLCEYEEEEYRCFNDFFTRKIKGEKRPICREPSALIAPCDGLLSVYPIREGAVIPVKQSSYTLTSLVGDKDLAARYEKGLCLVFRLCVHHYHRYVYVDGGNKGENIFLPGRLHTVRPIALEEMPVFIQNCRAYTVIQTENFGDVLQMEVGAMLVGKIKNYHGSKPVQRGEEKGMFLYGGSTVIVLLEEGTVDLPAELFAATAGGKETPVLMGQQIGKKIQSKK